MGDCGLVDGDDIYGVFYPHNIWSLFADRLAAEAAEILGQEADAAEFRAVYERGRADLLASLRSGAIHERAYRWIPGTPNQTGGSRWGVLNAVFPCRVLAPDDDLARGTLRHIESRMSPGGLPLNTGYLSDGIWVSATLDNVAASSPTRWR